MSTASGRELVQPWADDVPLLGAGVPPNTGMIDWLIAYLSTVRERFGNTTVRFDRLRWGASALHAIDDDRSEARKLRDVASAFVAALDAVRAAEVLREDGSRTLLDFEKRAAADQAEASLRQLLEKAGGA